MRWDALNSPEGTATKGTPILTEGHRVLQGSPPGWRYPQLPTVPLVEPQARLWRVWLWKNTMQEGVNKNMYFWSCALIFFSAVQAFLWKLETKRPLMYGATWKQRQQRRWDRKGNCFPHVPIMGHWQGRQGVSCYDLSFVFPLSASCEPWAVSWEPTGIPNHGILWIQALFSWCCFCTAERWPWQIAWLLEVTPNLVHCHSKHHSGLKTWWENIISTNLQVFNWCLRSRLHHPSWGSWDGIELVSPLWQPSLGPNKHLMEATTDLGKIPSVFQD